MEKAAMTDTDECGSGAHLVDLADGIVRDYFAEFGPVVDTRNGNSPVIDVEQKAGHIPRSEIHRHNCRKVEAMRLGNLETPGTLATLASCSSGISANASVWNSGRSRQATRYSNFRIMDVGVYCVSAWEFWDIGLSTRVAVEPSPASMSRASRCAYLVRTWRRSA